MPAEIQDSEMVQIFEFRKKGRVPVLVYRHDNHATLCRCSQPRSGLTFKRCPADERFFELVARSAIEAAPDEPMHILDARPRVNTLANAGMFA